MGAPELPRGQEGLRRLRGAGGRPCTVTKQTKADQELLVEDERFYRSPYVGKHGWVSMATDVRVGWGLVEDLVLRSYRLVALKRMLRALDGGE